MAEKGAAEGGKGEGEVRAAKEGGEEGRCVVGRGFGVRDEKGSVGWGRPAGCRGRTGERFREIPEKWGTPAGRRDWSIFGPRFRQKPPVQRAAETSENAPPESKRSPMNS